MAVSVSSCRPERLETGWKTPPQIRLGGDFKITANVVITKLPKPAQEDGVAVGVAIAEQDINQPDVTFIGLREPSDAQVYRSILKPMADQNQMQMQTVRRGRRIIMMNPGQPAEKPAKAHPGPRFRPPAMSYVSSSSTQGSTVRFQVLDTPTGIPRYLGQVELGPVDIAAVKLFVSNRNGAEAVNVLWHNITIQADRINGLGTVVERSSVSRFTLTRRRSKKTC